MARSRNIKPSFFMNEDLAELDFSVRLLFIGLWTLADREGRLEDRPKRIKRELFPSDNIDIDDALDQLEKFDFIKRYQFEELSMISITKFLDHQSPHGTEKDSVLPDGNGSLTVNERGKSGLVTGKPSKITRGNAGSNDVLTVKEPLCNETETVSSPCHNALIPDSLLLIPDSLLLIPDSGFLIPETLNTISDEIVIPPEVENSPPAPKTKKPSFGVRDLMETIPSLSESVASDYVAFRKQKKSPLNATSWKKISAEIAKCDSSPDDVLAQAMAAGWQGFKADWIKNANSGGSMQKANQRPSAHSGFDKIDYHAGINPDGSF